MLRLAKMTELSKPKQSNRKRDVVVIHPDHIFGELSAVILEGAGYTVHTYGHYRDVDLKCWARPDVLIIAIDLEDCTAGSLRDWIQYRFPGAGILLVSNWSDEWNAVQSLGSRCLFAKTPIPPILYSHSSPP